MLDAAKAAAVPAATINSRFFAFIGSPYVTTPSGFRKAVKRKVRRPSLDAEMKVPLR
jgi:hypothetical protein